MATGCALPLRSSLTLTNNALIVRTATHTHKISLQQVTHVSVGQFGIYISTSDGRKILSQVAARPGRFSQFYPPRAIVIVDAINNAIQSHHQKR